MKNKSNKNFEIINTIQQTLHYKQLVNPNEYILLAVSGGQDSICLLILFYFLKTQWNWVSGMVWCHHLWQKDSFYTMLQLARLGFSFHLPTYFAINSNFSRGSSPFVTPSYSEQGMALKKTLVSLPLLRGCKANVFKDSLTTPASRKGSVQGTEPCLAPSIRGSEMGWLREVRPLGKQAGQGVEGGVGVVTEKAKKDTKSKQKFLTEKNARDWRHRINQRICFFYNYNFCAQGHNGSDRVETVLFNLMRGSGKKGVCTLQWTKSRASFSLNKFFCSHSQQFKKPVNKLRMKTKYYYQVKSVLDFAL